jgi:hypothetical protein
MKIDHVDLEILYLVADEPLHFNELWRRLRERGIAISKQGLRSRIEKLKLLNILEEKIMKQYKVVSIMDENIRRIILAVCRYCEYIDRVLPSMSDLLHIQSPTRIYSMMYVYMMLLHVLIILSIHKVLPEGIYKLLTEKLVNIYTKMYSHFLTLILSSIKSRQELTEIILQIYNNIPISEEDKELRQILEYIRDIITAILKTS